MPTPSEWAPYPFDRVLEVMKPCKVSRDNPAHRARLDQVLLSSRYVAEPKIDGSHYLFIRGRFFSTHIKTRDGESTGLPVEKTPHFAHLATALSKLGWPQLILDGEICIPGGKSQDVTSISGCLPREAVRRQERGGFVHYTIFDVLRAPGGDWMLDQPWHKRRQLLERLYSTIVPRNEYIQLNPVVTEDKSRFLQDLLDQGREGIVLKSLSGLYVPGTRPMWNWIKVKAECEDDAIVMGFEPPERVYTGKNVEGWPYWCVGIPVTKYYHFGWIGSIILGKYDAEGSLVRISACSGMTEQQRQEFTENPSRYVGQVAKIRAMEITRDGSYRHPAFICMHPDKNPHECRI